MIMVLIFELLENQAPWQATAYKGIRFICTLCFSMLLYLVMVRITTPTDGLTNYMGINQIGITPLSEYPEIIIEAFKSAIRYFRLDSFDVHYSFMASIFIISFILCAVTVIIWCLRKQLYKEPMKMLLLIVLIVLFPIGCNIVRVMSTIEPVHILMIYGKVLIPILMLAVLTLFNASVSSNDEQKRTRFYDILIGISTWVISLTIVLCIFNYFIVSNMAYLKLFFTYEHTYSHTAILVSRIQGTDGYTIDKEIIMVGEPYYAMDYPADNTKLVDFSMKGIIIDYRYMISPSYLPLFLKLYHSFTQDIVFLVGAIENPELEGLLSEMTQYPNDGSIVVIDDRIIVKFYYPN